MPINKIIYSKRIMELLVAAGNIPLQSMANPYKPEFQCWIFEVTDKFQKDMDKILGGSKHD